MTTSFRSMILGLLASCLLPWSGCSRVSAQEGAGLHDVSLVQLIAVPERFHKKRVRLIGFLRLEFEGNAIYLHQEDFKRGITANALWFDAPDSTRKRPKHLSDRYVIVEAVFDSQQRGHMGMFSGTLTEVTRVEPWR